MDALPNELLLVIFRHLLEDTHGGLQNLIPCTLVNKKWNHLASEILLSSPSFHHISQLDAFLIHIPPSKSHHVQSLSLSRFLKRSITPSHITSLLKACPNISAFHLASSPVFTSNHLSLLTALTKDTLKKLYLDSVSTITDDDIKHSLDACSGLTELGLFRRPNLDTILTVLPRTCPKLLKLSCMACDEVTQNAVESLKGCLSLSDVFVSVRMYVGDVSNLVRSVESYQRVDVTISRPVHVQLIKEGKNQKVVMEMEETEHAPSTLFA